MSNQKILQTLTEYEKQNQQATFYGFAKEGEAAFTLLEKARRALAGITIPTEAEAVAACLDELNTLAAEWHGLAGQIKPAVEAQYKAARAHELAKLQVRYAQHEGILGLDLREAIADSHKADAASFVAASNTEALRARRALIYDHIFDHYQIGVEQREKFQRAAAARVRRIFAARYQAAERQQAETILQKLGVQDIAAFFAGLAK